MFYHDKRLQYKVKPAKPDALFAAKVQELLGGQYGEMTVMTQYLFQGFSCRGPAMYKDMIMDIATEEIGHVEMLCTLIAYLLEDAPLDMQEKAIAANPGVAAIIGGMNFQQAIVSGGNARPTDSLGNPWTAAYISASGNMFADFHSNLNAETQGRLQVCRVYEQTQDPDMGDAFRYMIARETMHQNQWLAAIEQLKMDGLDQFPLPVAFDADDAHAEAQHQFWNLSKGTESQAGRWASGPSMDGKGQFTYLADPQPLGPVPDDLPAPDARLFDAPQSQSVGHASGAVGGHANGNGIGGTLKHAVDVVKDAVSS